MIPSLMIDYSKLPSEGSRILLELADGKHTKEVEKIQRLLTMLGRVWPPAFLISQALSAFLFINKLTAPEAVIPDGRGGFVPTTNSRVHPSNRRFIRWDGSKWIYDDMFGGDVAEKFQPPAEV